MFDFDAGKFLIIGVVALVVIGPKELPRVLRQVGQAVGKMRRMAAEFQGQFMDAMKEADIESIKDDLKKISQDAELNAHFDPARDIQRELTSSFDTPAPGPGLPAPAIPVPGEVAHTPSGTFAPVVATEASALPEPDAAFSFNQVALADAPPPAALAAPDGVAAEAGVDGAVPLRPGKKRKIRVAKRQGPGRRVHAVADRTAFGRGTRTSSPLRARAQEIAER